MRRLLGRGFIIAFVVVDILLVLAMIAHVNAKPKDDADEPASEVTTSAPTSAAPTSTASSSQDPYDFRPSTSVVISSGDGTVAFALRGKCPGTAPIPVGVSTSDSDAPLATPTSGLYETLAIKVRSATDITAVGSDDKCNIRQISSTNAGNTWKTDPDITLWYLDPDDTKSVVSPTGSSKPGCTVTTLSQLTDASARVTCTNGDVRGTGDGGKSWLKLGRLDNIRVATFTAPGRAFALAKFQGCAAQAFSTKDGGRTWTEGGCITGDPAQAIAATPTRLTALVGDQLFQSDDFGKSWSQPKPS